MEFRERMRLCVITPYYHPIKGGITSYVSYLVKTFQENTMTVDIITRLGEKQERVYDEPVDQLNYFTDKLFKREDSKYRLLDERLRMMGREVDNITKRINRIDGALRIVRRGVENITERIDRIENDLLRRGVEIENITERIDRIENDLTEHIYKPLAKGIGISTALLGILLAVSSSILAIPAFIISYLCFWGLWKSKKL